MSSDNAIIVLVTTDYVKQLGDISIPEKGGILSYRVAEVMAAENFEHCKNEGVKRLSKYMENVWGKSPVFYVREQAFEYAQVKATEIYEDGFPLEYGIYSIDAAWYPFPGTVLESICKKPIVRYGVISHPFTRTARELPDFGKIYPLFGGAQGFLSNNLHPFPPGYLYKITLELKEAYPE